MYFRGNIGCYYTDSHQDKCDGQKAYLAPDLVRALDDLNEAENNFRFQFDTLEWNRRNR